MFEVHPLQERQMELLLVLVIAKKKRIDPAFHLHNTSFRYETNIIYAPTNSQSLQVPTVLDQDEITTKLNTLLQFHDEARLQGGSEVHRGRTVRSSRTYGVAKGDRSLGPRISLR